MRVLLVEPPMSPFDVPQGLFGLPEPLPLEILAAGLLPHHDVQILDLRVGEGLEECLERFDPQVVGVGAVTSNLHSAERVLQLAKQHRPDVLTMIGGHHVSLSPQDGLRPYVDVIVIGEGDATVAEVVKAFEAHSPLEEVPGIVVNRDGVQHRTAPRALVDLNHLPRPARHLVARTRDKYFQRDYRDIVSLNTSRGCTNSCKFCTLWKMNQSTYRTRSAERVYEEIVSLEQSFIDFIEDNSIDDIGRVQSLAELLIKNNVHKKLKLYGRSDTIVKHEATIERLAEAGLELILIGLESCSDENLRRLNKRNSTNNNSRAIAILKKLGVRVASYFVVDPGFTVDDFETMWRYVDELELMDPVFAVLCPFPGSDLYEERRQEIVCDDYRLFDFFHAVLRTRLPLPEFYRQFSLLYERAYSAERQRNRKADVRPEDRQAYVAAFAEVMRRLASLHDHHRLVAQ